MRAEDITDEGSLQAWLEGRPRKDAVLIAARSAARVGPLIWAFAARSREDDLTPLPFLWSTLISGVAAFVPTAEIKKASRSASAAAYAADAVGDAVSGASAIAAGAAPAYPFTEVASASASASATAVAVGYSADVANFASAVTSARDAIVRGLGAVASSSTDFFAIISKDAQALEAGADLGQIAIWPAIPPEIARAWAGVQELWQADSPDWQFWTQWYQALLDGKPQNLDLLTEVALIPPEDWDKGAAHVNAIIAGIRLKYIVEATPNSEDVLRDSEGLFYTQPVTTIRPNLFENAKAKVADTCVEIREEHARSPNKLAAILTDIARLEKCLVAYSDVPQRIHDVFERVGEHIDANLASGELPDEELVRDLRTYLDDGAIDIRRADEEVARTVKSRRGVKLRRLAKANAEELRLTVRQAADESLEPLAQELESDYEVALTGPESAESDESSYRLWSRLTRMAKRRKDDVLKIADDAGKADRAIALGGKIAEKAPNWWDKVTELAGLVFGNGQGWGG